MSFHRISPSRVFAIPLLDTLVLALLAAGIWMATHRYQGIWHDGVLYAGQAIFRMDPVPFAKDLFFAYGSQDGFTGFTGIYALAIQKLGLPTASKVLVGIAHAVWFAAAVWLLRSVLRGLAFWQALILVIVLPQTYGSFAIFSYSETFLTARIWAEPPALLAVAFILRGQKIAALISLVFAVVMHPVIAFPAVLFVFLFGFRGRQQLVCALLCLAGLTTLLAAGIPPFADLTKAMDPLWLRLSIERSPFVFLAQWKAYEYREPIFLALLLATAALASGGESRRVWWSALGVFLVGMGLALLAVSWPGVLLVQMQPWRVLWLTKILSVAAGVRLLQDMWLASPYSRVLLGALVACVFTLDSTGLVCAVFVSALIVARQRFGFEPRVPTWFPMLAWSVVVVVIGEKVVWAILLSSVSFDLSASSLANLSLANRVFMVCKESGWLVFPPLMFGAWWLLRHQPTSRGWLALLVGSVALFCAGNWHRTNRYEAEEDHIRATGAVELAQIIQPRHLVYWGEGYHRLWFILHRGSYASTQQAAGLIFSRQTAIESDRRLARLRKLGLPDSRLDWLPKRGDESPKLSTNLLGLIHVCHDPILDFVVLSQLVVGASPLTTIRLSRTEVRYYLYACAALRGLPDPFPVTI